MKNTWTTRELPVLEALVTALDDPDCYRVDIDLIATVTGMPLELVRRALAALARADPPYLIGITLGGGSYPEIVTGVTERALEATGQWPTAEDAVSSLAAALAEASDKETEPERKSKLRFTADALGGIAREVAVGWAIGAIPTP